MAIKDWQKRIRLKSVEPRLGLSLTRSKSMTQLRGVSEEEWTLESRVASPTRLGSYHLLG